MECCLVRLTVVRTRDPRADAVQLRTLRLFDGNNLIRCRAFHSAGGDCAEGEDADALMDTSAGAKWRDARIRPVICELGTRRNVDGYAFVTAFDMPECDPVAWALEGTVDGQIWKILDWKVAISDAPMPTSRLTASGRFVVSPMEPRSAVGVRQLRMTILQTRAPTGIDMSSGIGFASSVAGSIGIGDRSVTGAVELAQLRLYDTAHRRVNVRKILCPGSKVFDGHPPSNLVDGRLDTTWVGSRERTCLFLDLAEPARSYEASEGNLAEAGMGACGGQKSGMGGSGSGGGARGAGEAYDGAGGLGPAPSVLRRYALGLGEGSDARDPIRWFVEGSEFGVEWRLLDWRAGEDQDSLFPSQRNVYTRLLPLGAEGGASGQSGHAAADAAVAGNAGDGGQVGRTTAAAARVAGRVLGFGGAKSNSGAAGAGGAGGFALRERRPPYEWVSSDQPPPTAVRSSELMCVVRVDGDGSEGDVGKYVISQGLAKVPLNTRETTVSEFQFLVSQRPVQWVRTRTPPSRGTVVSPPGRMLVIRSLEGDAGKYILDEAVAKVPSRRKEVTLDPEEIEFCVILDEEDARQILLGGEDACGDTCGGSGGAACGVAAKDNESIASNESNVKGSFARRNVAEESRGFAVTVDQKDRQRAKFLDAKMYIHGIATRLGLGSDALADMRGFAIRGDPKMGRIFVSIPLHFEERLTGVIQDKGGGFTFRTLFPAESEVPDRSPVLMFVKQASTTAVRNATMAPKRNKDLWFSFIVGLDFQGIQNEARAALRTTLEACGFKVTKTPSMCYVKGTRIYNNMVHVEFSDYPNDVADHAWHEWAVGAQGLSVLCNGITLNINLHNMDPTFMRDALKVKPGCFHKHDKVCICKQPSNGGRGGNRRRPTKEERRAEKQAQQNAELEMLKQLTELNSTPANAGEEY